MMDNKCNYGNYCLCKRLCSSCKIVILWLLFFSAVLLDADGLEIRNFYVPTEVSLKDTDQVILDCDYSLGTDTKGLVVKWIFDDDPLPVYQWIPPRTPEVRGVLTGRLDTNYLASDDPLTKHRALKIVKLDYELSGKYQCQVSTFLEEDWRSESMTIFVPPNNLEASQERLEEGVSNISCGARGFYPEGILQFHRKTSGRINALIDDLHLVTTKSKDGLYTITAYALVADGSLPKVSLLECVLLLPGTSFVFKTNLLYSYREMNMETPLEITDTDHRNVAKNICAMGSIMTIMIGFSSLLF